CESISPLDRPGDNADRQLPLRRRQPAAAFRRVAAAEWALNTATRGAQGVVLLYMTMVYTWAVDGPAGTDRGARRFRVGWRKLGEELEATPGGANGVGAVLRESPTAARDGARAGRRTSVLRARPHRRRPGAHDRLYGQAEEDSRHFGSTAEAPRAGGGWTCA